MKVLREVSDEYVVLQFLQAEIASPRFGDMVRDALQAIGANEELILDANLQNAEQNRVRRQVLAKYRGWGDNLYLFQNFPQSIHWQQIELTADDVGDLHYINYSYWNELSKGSGLVRDAVSTVRQGTLVYGKSNDHFLEVSTGIESGKRYAEIILVAETLDSPLVILEGHLRATAYGLAMKGSDKLHAILGVAPGVRTWAKQSFG